MERFFSNNFEDMFEEYKIELEKKASNNKEDLKEKISKMTLEDYKLKVKRKNINLSIIKNFNSKLHLFILNFTAI